MKLLRPPCIRERSLIDFQTRCLSSYKPRSTGSA